MKETTIASSRIALLLAVALTGSSLLMADPPPAPTPPPPAEPINNPTPLPTVPPPNDPPVSNAPPCRCLKESNNNTETCWRNLQSNLLTHRQPLGWECPYTMPITLEPINIDLKYVAEYAQAREEAAKLCPCCKLTDTEIKKIRAAIKNLIDTLVAVPVPLQNPQFPPYLEFSYKQNVTPCELSHSKKTDPLIAVNQARADLVKEITNIHNEFKRCKNEHILAGPPQQ